MSGAGIALATLSAGTVSATKFVSPLLTVNADSRVALIGLSRPVPYANNAHEVSRQMLSKLSRVACFTLKGYSMI